MKFSTQIFHQYWPLLSGIEVKLSVLSSCEASHCCDVDAGWCITVRTSRNYLFWLNKGFMSLTKRRHWEEQTGSVAAALLTLPNVGMFFQMMESYISQLFSFRLCKSTFAHRNVQRVPSRYKYPSCEEHTKEATAALKTVPTKRTKCGKLNMSMLWRIGNWAFSVPKTLSVIKVSIHKEQETVVCCRISLSLLLLTAWSCWADGIHRDDGLSGETLKNTPEARLQRDAKDLKCV